MKQTIKFICLLIIGLMLPTHWGSLPLTFVKNVNKMEIRKKSLDLKI